MKTSTNSPQVLVAGAGPVGLVMASELSRHGVAVRIVEKAPARTEFSKALVLWSRTLELMEAMGCIDAFLAAGMEVRRANIFARGRRLARMPVDIVESTHPCALFVPQSETERLLGEHLEGRGVKVERRVELSAFQEGTDGVEATLQSAEGGEERLRVGWLVGCDGAHSSVRHGLGLQFAGETEDSDWFLADVRLEAGTVPGGEVSIFWHPEGVLVFFPITPGRFVLVAPSPGAGGAAPLPGHLVITAQAVDAPAASSNALFLVRPDGYLGYVTRAGDGASLRTYLDSIGVIL